VRFRVSTPIAIVVDEPQAVSVRAEDASGHFGILPGHADFLTVLEPSVVTWRDGTGREHFAAVRGGILTVQGGRMVDLVTREAVAHDDLAVLREAVLAHLRDEAKAEAQEKARAERLHLAFVRHMTQYLRSGANGRAAGHGLRVRHPVEERP
jgi:F-type H+-transporting ATPase subunit epsilon